jgi:hypothetical protein
MRRCAYSNNFTVIGEVTTRTKARVVRQAVLDAVVARSLRSEPAKLAEWEQLTRVVVKGTVSHGLLGLVDTRSGPVETSVHSVQTSVHPVQTSVHDVAAAPGTVVKAAWVVALLLSVVSLSKGNGLALRRARSFPGRIERRSGLDHRRLARVETSSRLSGERAGGVEMCSTRPDLRSLFLDLHLLLPDVRLRFLGPRLPFLDLRVDFPDLRVDFPDWRLTFLDLRLLFLELCLLFLELRSLSLDFRSTPPA